MGNIEEVKNLKSALLNVLLFLNGYRVILLILFQHTKPFFRITQSNILIFEFGFNIN